jgi:LysM repeat protein
MFTLIDRDVVPPIFLFPFLLFLLVPDILSARFGEKGAAQATAHYSHLGNDSYENHMPCSNKNIQDNQDYARNGTGNHRYVTPGDARKKDNLKKYTSYKVQRGDTITRIYKKFKIPIARLCAHNNIKNDHSIMAGTLIKIPTKQKPLRIDARYETVASDKTIRVRKPQFRWPLAHITEYKKDEFNGVRPIGIIIIGNPGSSVMSSATGVVAKIGRMRGYGHYIVISHPGRYATVYSNLDEITVSEGEKIIAGNTIGKIGKSDSKIHFQIDLEGRPKDPLGYLPKN